MAKYVKNDELLYELILCKGKGEVSPKLAEYFYLISYNMRHKFNIPEFHDDQISESVTDMLETWYLVDTKKYDRSVFSYFSERSKRSYVKVFNVYLDRSQKWDNRYIPKVSLSSLENKF